MRSMDNNKQIIFSSDRSTAAIPDIAERLRGRLGSGMSVDISEPDPRAGWQLYVGKQSPGILLSDEVIEIRLHFSFCSIRELEGMVTNCLPRTGERCPSGHR